jgi:hypothetical protein
MPKSRISFTPFMANLRNDVMKINDLGKEVSKIKWFHKINLGNGIITPGDDTSPAKLKKLGLPEDLREKTVLDIGPWMVFSLLRLSAGEPSAFLTLIISAGAVETAAQKQALSLREKR